MRAAGPCALRAVSPAPRPSGRAQPNSTLPVLSSRRLTWRLEGRGPGPDAVLCRQCGQRSREGHSVLQLIDGADEVLRSSAWRLIIDLATLAGGAAAVLTLRPYADRFLRDRSAGVWATAFVAVIGAFVPWSTLALGQRFRPAHFLPLTSRSPSRGHFHDRPVPRRQGQGSSPRRGARICSPPFSLVEVSGCLSSRLTLEPRASALSL
jgi:hypothetical protein